MIDIEKFICSLLADHPEGVAVRGDIHKALKEQGLEYKDGKIVPIEDKNELKESEDEFEKNRLEHCDSITDEQFKLEQDFVCSHIEKYHRPPTFLDAIEYGIKLPNNKNKYINALERAKKLLKNMGRDEYFASMEDIKNIFPELKDSDERVRKEIARFIRMEVEDEIVGNKWLAYLEKQSQTFTKKDVDDAWLKGMCDAKHELEKQGEQKSNPYSGTSFEYNGHTWGMCARDGGVEILIDGHIKGRVFINDSNAKEMFIKALERVEEQNAKGYKLTDCDKNSWWEDFKAYSGYSEQVLANSCKTCKDEQKPIERKDFISIPFGAFDSELIEETITIPDGCVATIEGNKIHIKKK